jgi:heme/copper-type cytochrome/quinol oxidase subunit 3
MKHFYKNHPFHITNESYLPFSISLYLASFLYSFVSWLHGFSNNAYLVALNILCLLLAILYWGETYRNETQDPLIMTDAVARNILCAMILFILSEAMLFVSFFWAFFSAALSPSIFGGNVWPPVGIKTVNPWVLPLLNTLLLLSSGISVNAFYYTFKGVNLVPNLVNLCKYTTNLKFSFLFKEQQNHWIRIFTNLYLTIFYGFFFLIIQAYEYIHAPFNISDGIYGSVFYMLTGLHGFHVILGLSLLVYALIRLHSTDFNESTIPHVGITCTVWYWHFVDVVWVFVYIWVYIWGC